MEPVRVGPEVIALWANEVPSTLDALRAEAQETGDPSRLLQAFGALAAGGHVEAARVVLNSLKEVFTKSGQAVGASWVAAELAFLGGDLDTAELESQRLEAALEESGATDAQAELRHRRTTLAILRAARHADGGELEEAAAILGEAAARAPHPALIGPGLSVLERQGRGLRGTRERLIEGRSALLAAQLELDRLENGDAACVGHHRQATPRDPEAAAAARVKVAEWGREVEARESALDAARAQSGRWVHDNAAPGLAGQVQAELTLVEVHRGAGDLDEAERLLTKLSERLGQTAGPEAAAWRAEVSARQARDALVAGDLGRAQILSEGAILALAAIPQGPTRTFHTARLSFLSIEAELAKQKIPDPSGLLRLIEETPQPDALLGPIRARMTLRLAGVYAARGEDTKAHALYERLATDADPEVRSQALLARGLSRLERGDIVTGLRDLRTAQELDEGGPVDQLLRRHPALDQARDTTGRVIIAVDAGALSAGLARAFVASQETPSWRKVGLPVLGLVIGGPWGAAAGLALDGALGVAAASEQVAAATQTGVSGVSREALVNDLFLFAVDVASVATAGVAGHLARSTLRLGVGVVAESAANFVPRVVGARVLGRGALAVAEGAVESLFGDFTARATASILTGTPLPWSPEDALRTSLAGALLGTFRSAVVPGNGLRAGARYAAETSSALVANELALQLFRAARGEASELSADQVLEQLAVQAKIDLGLGLTRRGFGPLSRLVSSADAEMQVRLRNAEGRLPRPGAMGPAPSPAGAGPFRGGLSWGVEPTTTPKPVESRRVEPGRLAVTMDGRAVEVRYEDPRDKHTMLAELPAEEIARRYKKGDKHVRKHVDDGSQLGREAYERYPELVRLAAEQGVEYKGHRWVEAPFVVGFDKKHQVLTRWLRMDAASNGRGGLNGAHLIPFVPRREDLKAIQLLRSRPNG